MSIYILPYDTAQCSTVIYIYIYVCVCVCVCVCVYIYILYYIYKYICKIYLYIMLCYLLWRMIVRQLCQGQEADSAVQLAFLCFICLAFRPWHSKI